MPGQQGLNASPELPVFCTQDVKICDDGTAVSRVPPDCDFADCPESSIQPESTVSAAQGFSLVAAPSSGEVPLLVRFSYEVKGSKSNGIRCIEAVWQFGDGMELKEQRCSDDWRKAVFSAEHRYEAPGSFEASLSLGMFGSGTASVSVLPEILPPECDEDSDCVPAQCCHPADCIIREKRPDCSDVFCTQECRPGTLDCGGSCACVNHRCTGRNFQPGRDSYTGPRPWQVLH